MKVNPWRRAFGPESRDDLRRLADEQAALRRVATLVASTAPPEEVFAAVTKELGQLFPVDLTFIYRYDTDNMATLLGAWANTTTADPFPLGGRWSLEGRNLVTMVAETGRPARIESYAEASGPLAVEARKAGLASGVSVPIVVDGQLWGTMSATTWSTERLPLELEDRIGSFTELLATAIANAESSANLGRLAEEQAALRRVATLVAEGAPAAELFDVVAREVMLVLDVPAVLLHRFGPGRAFTVVAAHARDDPVIFPVGSTFPLDGPSVSATVFDTGSPARVDDYADSHGTVAATVRLTDVRSSIGVPVTVDGALWGVMVVGATGEPVPAGTEDRLREFTELIAAALSSANAREGLRRLAEEQAALRRVATRVAEAPASTELFAAVTQEAARLLDLAIVSMARFEQDGTATVIAAPPGAPIPVGANLVLDGPSVIASILETGRPARIDDYTGLPGEVASLQRAGGTYSGFGSPIVVDGKIWGAMAAAVPADIPVPHDAEARLMEFTELVATAISNTESRDRVRGLADEQAALRRVATLVAEGASDRLFAAVAQEVIQLLEVPVVFVNSYGSDEFTVLAALAQDGAILFPVGSTWPLDGPTVATKIFRTGQSARVDNYEHIGGTIAAGVRSAGVLSSVGVPITVDGAVWGAIVVGTMSEPLPADIEIRLRNFTDLIGTAMSNAATHAQLIASRARLVAAGDEARRRIERNLHDGIQQRLIALGLDLQRARANIPQAQRAAHSNFERIERDLESVLEDVRELSRGLHPALLLRGGLRPAVRALARRSPIPVAAKISLAERPPASIEAAAYYIVAEALTNSIKHSQASAITITITIDAAAANLHATIADDGVGGAGPNTGSGLMGAIDRVDALGGRLTLESPPGHGTTISIELPVSMGEEPLTGSSAS